MYPRADHRVMRPLLAALFLSWSAAPPLRAEDRAPPVAPYLQVDEWIHGSPTSLAALRGKVVLLDFFQILCPGCHQAHPMIVDLQKRYGARGLQVVGVASAFELREHQSPRAIRRYVQGLGDFNYPVSLDEDRIQTFRRYRAGGTPWAVLVDRSGRIRLQGFFDPRRIEHGIQVLLDEEPRRGD